MPGPVSDSYDPFWSTAANQDAADDEFEAVYDRLTAILGGSKPIDVRKLVRMDLPRPISTTLTEKEWRLLRFCVESARENL